jgi:hypothetical protein
MQRSDVVIEVDQAQFYHGVEDECWSKEALARSTATHFLVSVEAEVGSQQAPLLFGIVVHIEPSEGYKIEEKYRADAERLRRVASIVASHEGKMTIQTQPPFVETDLRLNDEFHHEMALLGNEIALHMHEDVYVGADSDHLPPEVYEDAMRSLKQQIEKASGAIVTTWSGGNS